MASLSTTDRTMLYRNLVRVRLLEEAHVLAVADGKIPGFIHSGLGQEAIGVGGCTFLRPDDYLMPTHRGFSHMVAKGVSPRQLLAETYGKATGISRGKGGIHFASLENGIFGISGSIGGVFPIAVGQGIAAKRARRGQIVAAFFGDGAAQRGTFHECMNLAALWQLPIVWVCENNQYALSLPVSRGLATGAVADFAAAYRIASTSADGNDVEAVHDAVMAAVDATRAGGGPCLVELHTYRLRGHYEGEPAKYRSSQEAEGWMGKDPVRRQRARLLELGLVGDAMLVAIEAEAQAEVQEALRFADESPLPLPEAALEGALAELAP